MPGWRRQYKQKSVVPAGLNQVSCCLNRRLCGPSDARVPFVNLWHEAALASISRR
jgi:hypothetical protein